MASKKHKFLSDADRSVLANARRILRRVSSYYIKTKKEEQKRLLDTSADWKGYALAFWDTLDELEAAKVDITDSGVAVVYSEFPDRKAQREAASGRLYDTLLQRFVNDVQLYDQARDDEVNFLCDHPNRDVWGEDEESEYRDIINDVHARYADIKAVIDRVNKVYR